jgi:hypothetical protein
MAANTVNLSPRPAGQGNTLKSQMQMGIDARQGNAANLTRATDLWYNDPARERQTQDFMGAMRSQLGDDTTRGFTDTARGTKFRTARQGLTGGSVDARRQTRNLEDLFRQQMGDEAQVQDAGDKLRTQDFSTRQSLFDTAYGTADVGQEAMRRNALNEAQGPDWGDALYRGGAGIAGAFKQRSQNKAFLDAMRGSSVGGMPAPGRTGEWSLGKVGFGGG